MERVVVIKTIAAEMALGCLIEPPLERATTLNNFAGFYNETSGFVKSSLAT
jgi:hypothetical protein